MKVAIIGGGAAGFFAAISAKTHHPEAEVTLYEKTNKLLAKVRISGGGRCNVTNGAKTPKELLDGYPRGRALMKKLIKSFSNHDTQAWFESRSVRLKTEKDGRVFPKSDSSSSIVACLIDEAERLGIVILEKEGIKEILPQKSGFKLITKDSTHQVDKVIIASGGSPKKSGLDWIADLGHEIVEPVPSLFTFNMPKNPISKIMGVVAPDALVSIQGTKLKSTGPLLITHWGMSGPAILKLSSFGARELAARKYGFKITVNWINQTNESTLKDDLLTISQEHSQKYLSSFRPYGLPERLWLFLLAKYGIDPQKRWVDLGKKGINKITALLTNDEYEVKGKTTFKEEFVTSGGVSLDSIHRSTLESKACPGLYFGGEVLNIDGITGGYNFQAAWSTGFIAGQLKSV